MLRVYKIAKIPFTLGYAFRLLQFYSLEITVVWRNTSEVPSGSGQLSGYGGKKYEQIRRKHDFLGND